MKLPFTIKFRELVLSLIIGVGAGILRVWLAYQIKPYLGNGAGDFTFATRLARDLLSGHDPYGYAVAPDSVPYPLPAGILAIPFTVFEDEVASGLFIGLSSFILAWRLLGEWKKNWPLLVFLSWPFAYTVLFAQWTPLIMSMWFLPFMLPLILVKPHIALPLVLTSKISRKGLVFTFILLLVSLIILPKWPFIWLEQTRTYKGLPPLFSLPLGPLLFLALIKYRDRRAWLLLLFAFMPQRVLYDQLPLLLIATTGAEMIFLVFCSWLTLPMLLISGGWGNMPVNWQFWIILTLYLPALLMLLWSDIVRLVKDLYAKQLTDRSKSRKLSPHSLSHNEIDAQDTTVL